METVLAFRPKAIGPVVAAGDLVTTPDFLVQFGLDRVSDLPGIEELKAWPDALCAASTSLGRWSSTTRSRQRQQTKNAARKTSPRMAADRRLTGLTAFLLIWWNSGGV